MTSGTEASLTPHPGDDARSHLKAKWRNEAKRVLAAQDLFLTAEEGRHVDMEAIKLQRTLPELTPEHDDANSRLEYNERVRVSNSTKIYQRRHIIVAALTRTYNLLAQSCKETAPLIHELMRQHCDMSRYDVPVAGGAFDGYRAWHIIEQNFHKERTDEDIEYYEAALRLQVDNSLADGCSPDEFVSKATTFVIDIAPFLGRPYSPVEHPRCIRWWSTRIQSRWHL